MNLDRKDRVIDEIQESRRLKIEAWLKKYKSPFSKVIQKLLIANNGMAAVKGMKSISKWAFDKFGDENMIEFVVMATPEDLVCNSEFIRMADVVIHVPGGPNHNNYANVDLILNIARAENVDVSLIKIL